MHGIVAEYRIIEIVPAKQQPGQSNSSKDEYTGSHHGFNHPIRHQLPRGGYSVDQRVKNDPRRNDDSRLETATRAKIPVKLHVKRKEQYERDHQPPDHTQYEVVFHASSLAFSGPFLRRRSSAMTPAPAVNTTVVSPSVS